jgi:two-component system phosphate regulon sensor histidine kinase PhoR
VSLGVRGKLFFSSVFLICLSLIAVYLYLSRALEADLTRSISEELESRVALVESQASSSTKPLDDTKSWDALADDLGARARLRVTLIRKDGLVLGDSEVYAPDLAALENHADRPEVIGALQRGIGTNTRFSHRIKQQMMYLAVPFKRDGEIAGVARVAMPLTQIEQAKASLSRTVLAGSLAGVLLAIALSWMGANWLGRRVGPIVDAARRMSAGDLGARSRLVGGDELGELGATLDSLARSLSTTMTELKAERDVLSGVLEGMTEGVLLLDARGTVALMNPALREMLLLQADVVGRPLLDVVRNAELKELIDKATSGRDALTAEIELGGLKPRRVLVRAGAFGEPRRGLLAVFVDVTDVRRLESLRRDFVANVSHELRTPVAAIISAAETLRDGAVRDAEAAPRFVDIVVRNGERLQHLIEDLLELSRIESRELKLKPETVELEPLARGVCSMVQDRAQKKKITLSVDVASDARTVRADRRALEQILTNLVDNAVKYCGEGAKVVTRARVEGRSLRLSVEDTGPGIAPAHLPRLFERFYRVDTGRSRELGGTGLGLAIVKHLAEACGGKVDVESTVGKGSTFIVTIPRESERDSKSYA